VMCCFHEGEGVTVMGFKSGSQYLRSALTGT
jgi:hypothetical protein